jgi:membrane protein
MFRRLFEPVMVEFRKRAAPAAEAVNRVTGGSLHIISDAMHQYGRLGSSEAAAGLTFYAVFSLFPLLALAVTITSLFVAENNISNFLLNFLTPVFPLSRSFIDQNIQRFIGQRGAVSILGVIGLLWSASNVFALLTHHINRAWRDARLRNFLQRRLLGLTFIGLIMTLLAFSLILTALSSVLIRIEPPILRDWLDTSLRLFRISSRLINIVVTFMIFLFIYRYVPRTRVRFSEAFWGALTVSVGWQITSQLFSWYLSSGMATYDVLYGSIAAIAILMFWLYLNNMMILMGAHISAAVSRYRRSREMPVIQVKESQKP